MNNENVYGLISYARTGLEEVVIIKSKARKHSKEVDRLSDEEFEDHWTYNIEGSKGHGQYSTIDDELSREAIDEILDDNEDIINPPVKDPR